MEHIENGQQVRHASSSKASTSSSNKRRTATSRPSSPVLRSREGVVKEESPEPELDEVCTGLPSHLMSKS
jgi:hypothetical protein